MIPIVPLEKPAAPRAAAATAGAAEPRDVSDVDVELSDEDLEQVLGGLARPWMEPGPGADAPYRAL